MLAINNENIEIAEYLVLNCSANVNAVNNVLYCVLMCCNMFTLFFQDKYTALHYAIRKSQSMAKILIDNGAQLDARNRV
jgi:hypothetical protein